MQQKLEFRKGNPFPAIFLKIIMGKLGFYNGGKLKILKFHFWPEKFTNTGLEYTKRCGIATFGGVCFLRKVHFVNIFMGKS